MIAKTSRDVVDVGGRRVHEPGDRVVATAGSFQGRRICVEETGRSGTELPGLEVLGLQRHDRLIRFTEVHAGTGFDDPHLGGIVAGQ